MKKYFMNDQEYVVNDDDALLLEIKESSPHTRTMKIDDYRAYLANIIRRCDTSIQISDKPSASDIVEAWTQLEMISTHKPKLR